MLALGFGFGCQGNPSTPVVDSESHWLEECESGETCGVLECVCGVCSVPCAGDCGGAAGGAICADAPMNCTIPAGGMCTAPCDIDADCVRGHLLCIDGACLPMVSPPPDDGGLPPPDVSPMADAGPGDAAPADDMSPPDMSPPDMSPPDMSPPDMSPADGAAPDMSPPDMSPPDAAPPIEGECAHPDSDCFADGQCADDVCSALLPDGPCVCTPPAPAIEREMCEDGACCEDADCPAVGALAGRCRSADLDEQNAACGAGPGGNICVVESCQRDADCGGGKTCIRPGEYGHAISACVDASCLSDADCVARDGGQCTAFMTPCFVRGFHCSYDGDACREDADCPQRGAGQVCQPDGRGTVCVEVQ